MKTTLLKKIYSILPSNLDCGISNLSSPLHSITLDSDGRIRLCLRIRGIETPIWDGLDLIYNYNFVRQAMVKDKEEMCELCNHTCYLMSQLEPQDIVTHGE